MLPRELPGAQPASRPLLAGTMTLQPEAAGCHQQLSVEMIDWSANAVTEYLFER